MELVTSLAQIKGARLLFAHGQLTGFLDLSYSDPGRKLGESGQGFGGYGLGGEYGGLWIAGIMGCLGVERWEDVVGKFVYAEYQSTKVHRITSVDTGRVFDPTEWSK